MTGACCQGCPQLDIVWRKKGKSKWQQMWTGVNNIDVTNVKDPSSLLCFSYDISIINAKADQVRECQRCRGYFTQAFQIPKLWWTASCRNSNGYFGCEDTTDEQGNLTGLNTWARFLVKHLKEDKINYDWDKLNVFTRWLPSSNQIILLTFDTPPLIAERLLSLLLDELDVEHFGDPFWIYTLLVEEVVRLQDQVVWAVRNHVRAMENEAAPATKPKPNYRHLHDISRHAIHVSETLDIAVKTMDSILMQHKDFTISMFQADRKLIHASKQIHNRLLFHQHMLTSLRHRSASNKQRLLNEIQLSFNTVAQYDSGISVEIGRAAQVDSAAMKTIAFLTLAFLPATFVSAIFSMSFFNYNADTGSWAVSDKFWVYWAVAVPTTIVTSLSWYYWQKALPPISIGEDRIDEAGVKAKDDFADITSELQENLTGGSIKSLLMWRRQRNHSPWRGGS